MPQIVDDQQGHGHEELHLFFACAVECRFCEFIEQGVGFTVEHAVALLDGCLSDGLGQVTLAGAGRTEKQGVFVPGDESAGRQIEHQAAVHLLIKAEVEVVEGLLRVAKLGLLCSTLQ
jgi:hypothetical protein